MAIDEDSLLADGRITQRMFGGWAENPSETGGWLNLVRGRTHEPETEARV